MTKRPDDFVDTEIVHLLTVGAAPYVENKFRHRFRHNAFFVGSNVREAVAEGRADYTPIFLSEIPALFKRRRFHLDVALVQVTPPDAHGFCSFGVSVDIVKPAAESADVVIAEVNPRMPRTLGDSFIHVDQIDILVEHEAAIPEFRYPEPDEVAQKNQNLFLFPILIQLLYFDEPIAHCIEHHLEQTLAHKYNSVLRTQSLLYFQNP